MNQLVGREISWEGLPQPSHDASGIGLGVGVEEANLAAVGPPRGDILSRSEDRKVLCRWAAVAWFSPARSEECSWSLPRRGSHASIQPAQTRGAVWAEHERVAACLAAAAAAQCEVRRSHVALDRPDCGGRRYVAVLSSMDSMPNRSPPIASRSFGNL
jgi:hypothetical protein